MAASTSTKLAGFNATLRTSAGSLDNNVFFASKGSVTIFGNTVQVVNSLSFGGGQLQFHTEVDVDLTIHGYALGSGHLELDSTNGVSFAGNVNLARFGAGDSSLTVTLSGTLTPFRASPIQAAGFDLTATVAAQVVGVPVTLDVAFTQGVLGTAFKIGFAVDSGALDVAFTGSVDSTLKFCASATASVRLIGFANPTGSFTFCNKGTNDERGLRVTFAVAGYTFTSKPITGPEFVLTKSFTFGDSVKTGMIRSVNPADWKDDFKLGVEIDVDVDVTVDSANGVDFAATGTGTAFYKHWHDLDPDLFETDWDFGRHDIGSVTVDVDAQDRSACADVGFFGVTRELCI